MIGAVTILQAVVCRYRLLFAPISIMAHFSEYNEGLSQRQINQVRRLAKSGYTIEEICQIFRVSSLYVIRLLQGENSKKVYFLCPHCRRSFEMPYCPMCNCHDLIKVIDAVAHAAH